MAAMSRMRLRVAHDSAGHPERRATADHLGFDTLSAYDRDRDLPPEGAAPSMSERP